MAVNPLLNSFTYPATIAHIESFKTLKAKETLARNLQRSLDTYENTNKITEVEFTYRAYAYLLDKHYPDYDTKLPKFITETKDATATFLLKYYIKQTSKGVVIDPLHVLNIFKDNSKVFMYLREYDTFYLFTKLLGKHKLAPTVVLAISQSKHINFADSTSPTTCLKPSTSVLDIDMTIGIKLVATGWKLDTYNINKTSYPHDKCIDFYLFLLSNRNNIPSSFNYYWDTLSAALLEDYGDELITQFKDQLKQQTRSITNYIPKLKERK